ncbi:aldose 1-epimerase family protein [Flammeovirga kamogawensis]|uniref:Aldose 1-epimerase family protein n=1 Tax=Flammeovirga kamogawensis TaxID=373891 RepID=A0ABX8GX61_9BACT|nr:aldose 1-epimerase family protein [Flammeovirga kamogawensis]MBB6461136.1 galactose mutarotase-like enzyme [Flammeovirga kamogawensis]QWG07702.1 aldose 1-epimerase family protein [Flammeovirga kamogawensis]TRX69510.1 aldose 1-epimerase family protein [Flammeovirga kamogawensis]
MHKIVTLENAVLQVKISRDGAELHSIYHKQHQHEYLWQADKNVWGRHAPVLFPIVGQVEDGVYEVDGITYKLPQHGFARDMEHKLITQDELSCIFELRFNHETMEKYPYKFVFRTIYEIKNNKLSISYQVDNLDTEEIYFSVGAHPGFNTDFIKDTSFEDYTIEFSEQEEFQQLLLDDGLRSGAIKENALNGSKFLPLHYDTFKDDALIFDHFKSEYLDIFTKRDESRKLRIGFKNWPLLGIWTPVGKEANFVCIEPWYGVADLRDESHDFKEKYANQKLPEGETFGCTFTVEIIDTDD